MRVDEVLTTHTEGLAPLNRPIMVVALTGWFDASGAATGALEWLLRERVAPVVARILTLPASASSTDVLGPVASKVTWPATTS